MYVVRPELFTFFSFPQNNGVDFSQISTKYPVVKGNQIYFMEKRVLCSKNIIMHL